MRALGPSCEVLGPSRAALGLSWAVLGPSCEALGAVVSIQAVDGRGLGNRDRRETVLTVIPGSQPIVVASGSLRVARRPTGE